MASVLDSVKERLFQEAYPNTYAFAQSVKQEGQKADAATQAKYKTLEDSLKGLDVMDPKVSAGLKSLETNMADPVFRQQMKDLALKNPDGLRAAMPQILANGGTMRQMVAAEHGKLPGNTAAAPSPVSVAAAPAAAPAPAKPPQPTGGTQQPATPALRKPDAAVPPSPAAGAPAAAAPAAPQAAAPSDKPPLGDNVNIADKIAYIQSRPGYEDFYGRIKSNQVPAVSEAFNALLKPGAGGPDGTDSKRKLDDIMKRLQGDPDFFKNLAKTMDEKPGIASRIVSGFSDPKTGMGMLSMYSNFTNSGFGQILSSLMDAIMGPGAMDRMVAGIMGMVGGRFQAGNNGAMVVQSNNGGAMTRAAATATAATPSQITLIDPNGGKRDVTAVQLGEQGAAARGPNDPQQQSIYSLAQR